MEGHFDDIFNLDHSGEGQRITQPSWTERANFFEKNTISVGKDRDFQDLFDGESTNGANDSPYESEVESLHHPPDVKGISDEEILRVQEVIGLLRDLPRDEVARIKKRRSKLKSRSYALACRLLKQLEHEDLIKENTSLKRQLEDERNVWNEKDEYKRKHAPLQSAFDVHKHNKATQSTSPGR